MESRNGRRSIESRREVAQPAGNGQVRNLQPDIRGVHEVLAQLTAQDLEFKKVKDTLVSGASALANVVDLQAYRQRLVQNPANDDGETTVFVPRREVPPVISTAERQKVLERQQERQRWLSERGKQMYAIVTMVRDLRMQIAQAQVEEKNRSSLSKSWGKLKSWFGNKSDQYTPPDIFAALRSRFTMFDDQELRGVIKNTEQIATNQNLYNAVIGGGEKVQDSAGIETRMYSMGLVGEGGIAQVKDAVFLRGDDLVPAVVKMSHVKPLTGQNIQRDSEAHSINQARANAAEVEASNVQNYLKEAIPFVVRSLMVGRIANGGRRLIAYEKVADDSGRSADFDTIASNDAILPSQKFVQFSYAADGLAELHKRGLVHMDFKPANVMLDKNGTVKIIDPGSMFSIKDQIALTPGATPETSYITKMFPMGKTQQEIGLGYTPGYYDIAQMAQSQEKGLSLRDADRRALGVSLLDLLAGSQLIPVEATVPENKFTERAAFYASALRTKAGIDSSIFPPPSVRDMYRLAQSLIHYTDGQPQVPMAQVAVTIRQLSQRMQKEIDPLFGRFAKGSHAVQSAPYAQAA